MNACGEKNEQEVGDAARRDHSMTINDVDFLLWYSEEKGERGGL